MTDVKAPGAGVRQETIDRKLSHYTKQGLTNKTLQLSRFIFYFVSVLHLDDSDFLTLVTHGEVELPAHLVHGGAAPNQEGVHIASVEACLLLDLVVAVLAGQRVIGPLAVVGPRQLGGEPHEGVGSRAQIPFSWPRHSP